MSNEEFLAQVETAVGGLLLRASIVDKQEITAGLITLLRGALELAETAYARQVGQRTRAAPAQPAEQPAPRKRGRPAAAANKTGNGKVAAPADVALFPDGEPGL